MSSFLTNFAKPNSKTNIDDLKLGITMLNKIQTYIHENKESTYGLLMEQLCFSAGVPTRSLRKAISAYREVMLAGRTDSAEAMLAYEFKDTMTMIYDYVRSCLVSLAARKKMDSNIVKELIKTEYSSKGFLAEMDIAQEEFEEEASWLTNYEEDEFEREYAEKIQAENTIKDKLEV